MIYMEPDLTGLSPEYKVINDRRRIFIGSQVIEFNDAIYLDSIDMLMLGPTNKRLIKDIDWVIRDTDKDISSISNMKLIDDKFDKQLVKSITMIKPYIADYTINMSYQKLYPVPSKIALATNVDKHIEISPTLIVDMLETMNRLDALLSPVKDVHSPTTRSPKLLEIDYHKEYPENIVEEEWHDINVPGNVNVIHPLAGSFFKDSLKISYHPLGDVLKENDDYVIFGLNAYKTENTTNKSGIYDFILFRKPFVGQMKITYHAYGGDPTIYDLKAITENVNNVIQFVSDSKLVTQDTLAAMPLIQNLLSRVTYMENEMRALSTSGRPSYGDTTNGKTLLKKISSPDTKFHWWTIAELYKVAGSNTVYTNDMAKYNIQTLNSKMMYSVGVAVNLENEVKINVTTTNDLSPVGYTPFEDYSRLDEAYVPQFRVVWNTNSTEGTGALLQIGMKLFDLQDSVVIEDISGNESCFKLIDSVTESVLPEDEFLQLPNKNSIWDPNNIDSRQATHFIPASNGYLIWAGSVSLNRPTPGEKNITLEHFLEDSIDITKIKALRLDLQELKGNAFPVIIDFLPSELLQGSAFFWYNGKPSYIKAILKRLPTGKLDLNIIADVTSGLSGVELNIRQVIMV